ncbi:TolC family protein [Tunicatimonas pelagia]|uniref:TolC family protein n=1 Tax=Tunicatimonas pelagia TaxID=931531 RepID=UPI00266606DC|nr:TolC family protein [Tunicatimonas pelagia]WKN46243.1 TolC family protein [Tunicatimonas pelagia]
MKHLTFTFLSLFIVLSAQAQEDLSLFEAVQIGLENNFDIQIEELNIDVAQNNNNWGAAGRWPTITFDITQNNNFRDVDNPAGFQQGLTISNDITPGVNVNWTLFNGFSVQIQRSRLQELENLTRGNALVVIENAVQAIINQYYLAQLEQERLDVQKTVFSLSKDRYEYVRLKGELGSAVTFDILQEQNAFLTDSSNLVTQEINYLNTRRTLNLLMGRDVTLEYSLTDSLAVSPTDYALEDLYERMIASNSNLQNQYLNLEIAKLDTRLAKTELYPQLRLNAGAAYTLQRQDISNARFAFPDPDRPEVVRPRTLSYAAGFTLSYLLFDGGRVRQAIENTYTQERISQVQIEQQKITLRNNLMATYDLYNVRKKLLSISEENIRAAQLNLDLSEERFRNGTINSFDYRDIQVNYLNTALTNIQAKYDLIESETELLRLTGGILSEYENVN